MRAAASPASRFLAALLVLWLAACDSQPRFRGTDITGAPYGKTLALTGHDGKPRTLEDFRGKLVVLFFGFTHCPDVCPVTLSEMARAMQGLGRDADRIQVLFVTLDPERDTPQLLAQYVPAFDPRFLGLHGSLEQTRRVAQEYKIYFEKRPGETPGSYSIDHSAQSYVIDQAGRLRLFIRHERLAQDLPHDLRTLLAEKS